MTDFTVEIIAQPDIALEIEAQPATVVEILMPGPQGPAGLTVARKAGGILAAYRVVKATFSNQVVYPNLALADDADLIMGITLAAAGIGGDVGVKIAGPVTNDAWNWDLGAIYCGTSGQLTQTAPEGMAFVCRIATAISPTTIIVNPDRVPEQTDIIDPGDIAQYFLDALNP